MEINQKDLQGLDAKIDEVTAAIRRAQNSKSSQEVLGHLATAYIASREAIRHAQHRIDDIDGNRFDDVLIDGLSTTTERLGETLAHYILRTRPK